MAGVNSSRGSKHWFRGVAVTMVLIAGGSVREAHEFGKSQAHRGRRMPWTRTKMELLRNDRQALRLEVCWMLTGALACEVHPPPQLQFA